MLLFFNTGVNQKQLQIPIRVTPLQEQFEAGGELPSECIRHLLNIKSCLAWIQTTQECSLQARIKSPF